MALPNRSIKRYQLTDENSSFDQTTSLPSILGTDDLVLPKEEVKSPPHTEVLPEPVSGQLPTMGVGSETHSLGMTKLTQEPKKVVTHTPSQMPSLKDSLAPFSTKLVEAIREAPVLDPGTQKELGKLVSWKKAAIGIVVALFIGFLSGALVIIMLL